LVTLRLFFLVKYLQPRPYRGSRLSTNCDERPQSPYLKEPRNRFPDWRAGTGPPSYMGRRNRFLDSINVTNTSSVVVRHVTGIGSGLLEEIPRVVVQISALTKRATIGVRAPYATRRKLWYKANQVWMNTTFISQGPQSSGI
jgi:hypothetical protein